MLCLHRNLTLTLTAVARREYLGSFIYLFVYFAVLVRKQICEIFRSLRRHLVLTVIEKYVTPMHIQTHTPKLLLLPKPLYEIVF